MHRLLFVDHAPVLGGAEHSLLLLFEELDRKRFAPHLATQPGALALAARERDVTVHELSLPRLRASAAAPWRGPRGALVLARIARSHGIGLMLANTLRAALYAAPAARLARCPFAWHVRELVEPGLAVRLLAAASALTLAVSRAAAERLPPPVRVLPNGVRLEAFRGLEPEAARALRREWRVPAGARLVGQVARLGPQKGQHHLLEAAELVLREHRDVHFVLVGDDIFGTAPEYASELGRRAAGAELGDRVHLAGARDDVPAVLAALDLLVHPARDDAFGRILIEAAAAGLPVVAAASGGVPEVVEDGQTGLLVPPDDVRALASAVGRLLADSELARQLGQRGRALAERRYELIPLTRQLEDLLEGAMAPGESAR